MASVNKVILVGHLGKDPDVRTSQDGNKIVNFSIATSESWKDRASGERREKTEWHRVVVFNPHFAEVAEKYLKKGSPVYVEGALQTRKWAGNDGIDRYTTEVVIPRFKGELTLIGSTGSGSSAPPPPGSPDDYGTAKTTADQSGGQPPPDLDDEIPF